MRQCRVLRGGIKVGEGGEEVAKRWKTSKKLIYTTLNLSDFMP